MNPNTNPDIDLEAKYKEFISEIDEQFKREIKLYEESFLAEQTTHNPQKTLEQLPPPSEEPIVQDPESANELQQWRTKFAKNDITAFKDFQAKLDCEAASMDGNKPFERQTRADRLICQNRNFLFVLIEPFLFVKPHNSDKVFKLVIPSSPKRTDSKLQFEEISVSDYFQNDYLILFKYNVRLEMFLIIYENNEVTLKKCPMHIVQAKIRNFVWKKNIVFFQSENEIQYLAFSGSNGDFLNETYDNFFYMGKSLSLPEPFAYFDVSVIYDLFYVLNNDRILVYNNRNIPIHNFKPILDDMEHILCLKAFRKHLPKPTPQEEDDSSYYNHNDLVIILTNYRRLIIYDVAQMASGSESIFKIDEFDLADLFDIPSQPKDIDEFSLSPDSSVLSLKSKELGAIFFLKINSKYLTCASTNQLCLNIGERLRADSRTIQPKPFFPGNTSKENSVVKGKRGSQSANKLSEGNRRIYHTFFEFASCQLMPSGSLSYCVGFPSRQNWPADQPFALDNMDIISVYALNNDFMLLDYKLRLTILCFYKTTKDNNVQINLAQKFDSALEGSSSNLNKNCETNKPSATKEVDLENFPPDIPETIKLLCMKSKEKSEQNSSVTDSQAPTKNAEIRDFNFNQNSDKLQNQTERQVSDLLGELSERADLQAMTKTNEDHHLHRTPEYEQLPLLNPKPDQQAQPMPSTQVSNEDRCGDKVSGMVNLEDLENMMMKNVKVLEHNDANPTATEPAQEQGDLNRPIVQTSENQDHQISPDRQQSIEDKDVNDLAKQVSSKNRKREAKIQKQNDEAFAQSLSDLLIAFHDKIIGTINQFADESKKNIVKEVTGHLHGALKDNNKHFTGEFVSEFEKIINLQIDRLVQKSAEKFAVAADKTFQKISQKVDSTETAYAELAGTFNSVFKAHQETTNKINQFIIANKDALTPVNGQNEEVILTKTELKEINDGLQAIKENQKAIKEKLWALGQRVSILEIQRNQMPSSESLSRPPVNPGYRPMPKPMNPVHPYYPEYPFSEPDLNAHLINHYDLVVNKGPYPPQAPPTHQQQMPTLQWNTPPMRPQMSHQFPMSEPHAWPSNLAPMYNNRIPPRAEPQLMTHQPPVSFAPPMDQMPSTNQPNRYYTTNAPLK
jgi:hypothetical protein